MTVRAGRDLAINLHPARPEAKCIVVVLRLWSSRLDTTILQMNFRKVCTVVYLPPNGLGVERKKQQPFYCDYSRAATSCSKTTFLHTPVPWKPSTSRCSETNRHLVSVW